VAFIASSTVPAAAPAPSLTDAPRRRSRGLLWAALIALVVIGQVALWWYSWQHENARAQEATDSAAVLAAGELRQRMAEGVQAVQQLGWAPTTHERWQSDAQALMRTRREVIRLEMRDRHWKAQETAESVYHAAQFSTLSRDQMMLDAEAACASARRFSSPIFSRSYFMPTGNGQGQEVADLCVPRRIEGQDAGVLLATVSLPDLLSQALPSALTRSHEITWVDADGTRLARAGLRRGAGVYVAERLVDVAGFTLPLRLDSVSTAPRLIPNTETVLVLALSLALSVVLMMLVHDVRRRALAERHLAEALAFRSAMEDSLVTGLRARDTQGHIRYVNQAFCRMVGFTREELLAAPSPPYWPPDMLEQYQQRQAERMAGVAPPREGFETLFVRHNGERFPVMIFEAPLVDGRGRQTGWMSTVLDMSAQRRAEELSRQQQDKLQAAARLATMGEMASLLSHELNQPLSAIASYAHGSLNLLPATAQDPAPDGDTLQMLRQAIARIAEQADRAGRVIRSVHQFVRRRERLRENLRANELIEAVLPLVRLAARRSQTQIALDIPQPPPRVSCDRTMVEQVLLNLARNGLQAMEGENAGGSTGNGTRVGSAAPEHGVLTLRVRQHDPRWVEFSVIDQGPGVPEAVARQLFTPFFTTKAEGMGIGLAMCRTVIEQHGGALAFDSPVEGDAAEGNTRGTAFRFTLPAAQSTPLLPAAPETPA
jgi:two-component system sensor histidine kinase DctS